MNPYDNLEFPKVTIPLIDKKSLSWLILRLFALKENYGVTVKAVIAIMTETKLLQYYINHVYSTHGLHGVKVRSVS